MISKQSWDDRIASKNQFTVSYELLALLQWLACQEESNLKKIIQHALAHGLKQKLQQQVPTSEQNLADTIQYSIVEFFALLEALLLESIDEQTVQNAIEHKLMPAIDRIDPSTCDDETIRVSIEKTTAKLASNQQANAKELLFKELLKQWRPPKKIVKH
jgi:hypothetical protein